MIDRFSIQVSFLLFEAIFCFLSSLVYIVSNDSLRIRKSIVLTLNVTCGVMLICEYLFYVFRGSTADSDVFIMYLVNATVYYSIVLLLLFYTMYVAVRLFGRFDLKKDMPCRKRLIANCVLVVIGLILVTVSQFTGIYYYFDENNIYHRGSLFWLAAAVPTAGAILVFSILAQHRSRISKSQFLVLTSYLIMPIAGEFLQLLFFGNSFMNICVGLAVLLMFFENAINKDREIIRASKTEVRTGLANEHGCIEWLNEKRGTEQIKEYAAVFFDLRKFSDVNRRYGVENGNIVLVNYGNILSSKIGADELLGRQFGNQFFAIVKNDHLNDFLEILNGIEVPFADKMTGMERKVLIGARAGVYEIDRDDLDGEDIMVYAGAALNMAKSKEDNDVVRMTQDLIDSLEERKKLESDIKISLDNGDFKAFYQPKVDSMTGILCGAEALSRWYRKGEYIRPCRYIPIMEMNDTVMRLDFDMLRQVCADIAKWIAADIEVPVISINFSRRNLIDPNLAKHIDSIVRKSKIPKELIEIEVTETVDEFSIGVLKEFVKEMQELGYKVAIDDFGSASSSLTLLREIPFDTLKIDKGFVDKSRDRDLTILTHIIKLAKDIDIDIVAEGVEQKAQVDMLKDLGVTVIQGYFYDEPISADEMEKRLRDPRYGERG